MKIKEVSYVGKPRNNTAMFVAKKVEHLLANLKNIHGCKVFVENTIEIPSELAANNEFIKTLTPQLDYAKYVTEIAIEKQLLEQKRKYTLEVGHYYIGENVSIGKNTIIEPGCFIGHDVTIGDNAIIKSGAKIRNANIGDNFIAGENCTIGTSGFTMADDENGNKYRIPTLGKITIGNNVEIGALSNISCGSAGNTTINDYVKIDSFVHIGHDVTIGDNVEIPAGAIVGGFVILEDEAYVGINATLRNRIHIGKKAFVGMGAVVTKGVDDNVTVVGNPAKPFEKNKK